MLSSSLSRLSSKLFAMVVSRLSNSYLIESALLSSDVLTIGILASAFAVERESLLTESSVMHLRSFNLEYFAEDETSPLELCASIIQLLSRSAPPAATTNLVYLNASMRKEACY